MGNRFRRLTIASVILISIGLSALGCDSCDRIVEPVQSTRIAFNVFIAHSQPADGSDPGEWATLRDVLTQNLDLLEAAAGDGDAE